MSTKKSDLLPWTPENKAKLVQLFDVDGLSQAACAKEFTKIMGRHVSVSAIAGQVRVLRQQGKMQWKRTADAPKHTRRDGGGGRRHKSKKGIEKTKKKEPPPPKPVVVSEDLSAPFSFGENGEAMTYETMRPGRCLFMYGEPKGSFAFCGRVVASDRGPWCGGHHGIVYQVGSAKKKKHAPDDKKAIANAKFGR